MSSARNFTVESNVLFGNTSFIGSRGPNCSQTDVTPSPAPFVIDLTTVQLSTTQFEFQNISDGNGLTCILPPDGGDYWPFGGNPEPTAQPTSSPSASPGSGKSGLSGGAKAGIAVAVIFGVVGIAVGCWLIRRWAIKRSAPRTASEAWNRDGYVQSMENVSR